MTRAVFALVWLFARPPQLAYAARWAGRMLAAQVRGRREEVRP